MRKIEVRINGKWRKTLAAEKIVVWDRTRFVTTGWLSYLLSDESSGIVSASRWKYEEEFKG